jgi:hypothetical protein
MDSTLLPVKNINLSLLHQLFRNGDGAPGVECQAFPLRLKCDSGDGNDIKLSSLLSQHSTGLRLGGHGHIFSPTTMA